MGVRGSLLRGLKLFGGSRVSVRPPRQEPCNSGARFAKCAKQKDPAMTLRDAAAAVRENAYAPYSGFKVGAALRTPGGQVFTGCNVENVAYPEGTCAEAGAIAAMIAAGETLIAEAYVIADSPEPVPPCGDCRQKLAEFAGLDVVVTLANLVGVEKVMTLGQLLPGAFGKGHMDPA
ncbi:MAG: cytidine deaminase [Rhodobacterales bacterium]